VKGLFRQDPEHSFEDPRVSNKGSSVINLSQSFKLTSAQVDLLDRGLSFIPSHLMKKADRGSFLSDLGHFHAKVERAVFFGPREEGDVQIQIYQDHGLRNKIYPWTRSKL
jgi:hypothetical protein